MKHQLSHWKCVYYQMSLCSDLSEELVMGSRAKPEGGEMAPGVAHLMRARNPPVSAGGQMNISLLSSGVPGPWAQLSRGQVGPGQ